MQPRRRRRQPTRAAEVWLRMLRNLINCHEQVGDRGRLRVVRAMLEIKGTTPSDEAAAAVPYHEPEQPSLPPELNTEGLSHLQQQQLMRMLQVMQLAQQAS